MIDTKGIFRNRVFDRNRLLALGFTKVENGFAGTFKLPGGSFRMEVTVSRTDTVSVKVIDCESEEEYVLVHAPGAGGAFVGSVIQACEDQLRVIAEKCCDYQVFRNVQTMQVIEYVNNRYQDKLEFLWEKFPDNAIFRRRDTKKWYAAILTASQSKLGLSGNERVEMIDLRARPEEIAVLVDGKKYFAGYHMNKKHWYTICLDGSIPTREICEKIDASYLLATK